MKRIVHDHSTDISKLRRRLIWKLSTATSIINMVRVKVMDTNVSKIPEDCRNAYCNTFALFLYVIIPQIHVISLSLPTIAVKLLLKL